MPLSFRWSFRKKDVPLVADDEISSRGNKAGGVPVPLSPNSQRQTHSGHDETGVSATAIENYSDENPPFGIKILVDRSEKERHCVDIVAIHGLNGHREKTWRNSTTGVNWLSDEDCLQKDIPNARILTFGYNSRTYFSRSDSDVRDFASELLAGLSANRRTREEKQRPLVFICHSLGGIVFKQTVVKAHEQNNFYADILTNIRGVVFFGTPHRGSDLATWDRIGTALHNAGSFGYVTNTKLSKDLKVNAEFLKLVSESFVCRAGDLKIRSFYETELMKGLKCRVVEKESATLGLTNELAIACPAHHANICKFSSSSDERYKTAIFAIEEIARVTTDEQGDDEKPFNLQEQACMRALNSDYQLHLDQVDDPVSGTCEWVLSHETWLQWMTVKRSTLLWISADAGCGKSVMAKFLVKHLQGHSNSASTENVQYFFFKEGLDDQDNAEAAVSALLHQLCSRRHRLIRHVMAKYTSMPPRAFNRFSSLWSILIQIIESLTEDVTWVLDGLDECKKSSLEEFLKAMASYVDSRGDIGSQYRLKILLLGRPHNALQQRLQLGGNDERHGLGTEKTGLTKMRLRVEEETVAMARDISLFVQQKLIDLGQQDLLSVDQLSRLERKLIHGADLTFLWISLVVKLVEDAGTDGISAMDLEAILNTTQLDEVYERLLSTTPQPLKTKKVLMIVLAAVRPMTLKEMSVAVEVLQDHHLDQSRTAIVDYEASGISAHGEQNATRGTQSTSVIRGMLKGAVPKMNDEGVVEEETSNAYNPILHTVRGKSHLPAADNRDAKLKGEISFNASGKSKGVEAVSNLADLENLLRKPFSNHLRRICGHFVRIRSRRIYLIHQTARQFLLKPDRWSYDPNSSVEEDTSSSVMPNGFLPEPVLHVKLKPNIHGRWRHSIRLGEANQYLLQICAEYINLFRFEKPAKDITWTGKLVTKYLIECQDSPPRVFYRYAASRWVDHYRPLRRSRNFSYDYLLTPENSLFKVWIVVHRSWKHGKDKPTYGAIGILIPDLNDNRVAPKVEKQWEQMMINDHGPTVTLQDVLEHFMLDFDNGTDDYDSQWLTGPRYWKEHTDGNSDGIGETETESDETEDEEKHFTHMTNKIPDRIQYFRKQHRTRYAENWAAMSNPSNPSSYFGSGSLTYQILDRESGQR